MLCVIDPAVKEPELDCFNGIAAKWNGAISYHLPALFDMSTLDQVSLEGLRGVIILGSSSSVHDRFDWQLKLEKWCERIFLKNIPTLAICYGHQMIAQMYGAKVGNLPQKQLGSRLVSFNKNSPLVLKKQTLEFIVSHEEIVLDCPKGFEILAHSDNFSLDGLYHKEKNIWTIQAHPEGTALFCQEFPNKVKQNVYDDGAIFVRAVLDQFNSVKLKT